jgi:hypothetical protein
MRSPETPDLSGFLDEVGTTAEDVAALLRVRSYDRLDPAAYLAFLEEFAAKHPPTREIPPRHEPFVL